MWVPVEQLHSCVHVLCWTPSPGRAGHCWKNLENLLGFTPSLLLDSSWWPLIWEKTCLLATAVMLQTLITNRCMTQKEVSDAYLRNIARTVWFLPAHYIAAREQNWSQSHLLRASTPNKPGKVEREGSICLLQQMKNWGTGDEVKASTCTGNLWQSNWLKQVGRCWGQRLEWINSSQTFLTHQEEKK